MAGRKRRQLDLVGIQDFGLQVVIILRRLFRRAVQPVLSVKCLLKSDSLLGRKERFNGRNQQSRVRIKAAAWSAYAGLGFDALGAWVGRRWRHWLCRRRGGLGR